MKRLIFIILFLSGLASVTKARDADYVLLPDSSNFVKASLLVASPTNVIYSVFGHCAFRMECPSYDLDYCFSLEMNERVENFLNFFAGRAKARAVAVPTPDYLQYYREHGRQVMQYELNLTLHQQQEFWRMLDEEVAKGPYQDFDFLSTNCVSFSAIMFERAVQDETLEFGKLPEQLLSLNNGDLCRYHARRSPWASFVFMTFWGTAADDKHQMEYTLSPEMWVEMLQHATLIDRNGTRRAALKGKPTELLPLVCPETFSRITPDILFGLLLLLVTVITAFELRGKGRRVAKVMDIVLFVLQSLIGILLPLIVILSGLFGNAWNWYLIPFNPIPLLLWLTCRRRRNYGKVYGIYAAILLLFAATMPFITSQTTLAHILIVLTLAVRCFANYKTSTKHKS